MIKPVADRIAVYFVDIGDIRDTILARIEQHCMGTSPDLFMKPSSSIRVVLRAVHRPTC
jgi:hypothetical protein